MAVDPFLVSLILWISTLHKGCKPAAKPADITEDVEH